MAMDFIFTAEFKVEKHSRKSSQLYSLAEPNVVVLWVLIISGKLKKNGLSLKYMFHLYIIV